MYFFEAFPGYSRRFVSSHWFPCLSEGAASPVELETLLPLLVWLLTPFPDPSAVKCSGNVVSRALQREESRIDYADILRGYDSGQWSKAKCRFENGVVDNNTDLGGYRGILWRRRREGIAVRFVEK